MDKDQIITLGESINENFALYNFLAKQAEIKNFIANVAGKGNSFYDAVCSLKMGARFSSEQLQQILEAFLRSVKDDLVSNASYERKIQISVVNDYLGQAEVLLESPEIHSAVAAFLIGASLEEFLRNWIADENLDVTDVKPSLDGYANILKRNNLLDKQDVKEIGAWAGLRNQAAHGHWESVSDRDKIRNMLAEVNLFIKKYSS